MPRERVLATVVRLLEATLIRVGNEEYARDNGSFGLTTLRDRHVARNGGEVHLVFRGKSGIAQRIPITDKAIARLVIRCQDIPGQELFQWLDESGERRRIDSSDVNDYLREASGGDFTAKDFRTWFATVDALELLRSRSASNEREAKRQTVAAIARGRASARQYARRSAASATSILKSLPPTSTDGSRPERTAPRRARCTACSSLRVNRCGVSGVLRSRSGRRFARSLPAADGAQAAIRLR